MTKLKKTLSNKNLKKAILSLNLDMTMEELGARMGYSKAAVSKYLGTFPPSKAFLLKFEQEFGVNLEDFEEDIYLIDGEKAESSEESANQNATMENELLKELVAELRERVIDLKGSLETEKEYKEYFKKEYESLKTTTAEKNNKE